VEGLPGADKRRHGAWVFMKSFMKNDCLLYEMYYREYKYTKYIKAEPDINVSENANDLIMEILKEFKHTGAKDMDEIKFSDVICDMIPIIDETTHKLSRAYIFINRDKNNSTSEYVNRYKKFDINSLPLIEVAKYLNIRVEKSNILESFGCFDATENKIIMGSDYAPTFIHELVHAIDFIIPDYY
jgi:hypothetical protein